jgi:hypothetical protein
MTSTTGRCLCGAIRYRFEGMMIWTAHCHCESCRRNTASPMTTFFAAPKALFAFTGEEPASFASSPGVLRRFCRKCGTPVSYEYNGKPDEIHLYAASLDDSRDFEAQRHDFWNERVPWIAVCDDLPKDKG